MYMRAGAYICHVMIIVGLPYSDLYLSRFALGIEIKVTCTGWPMA